MKELLINALKKGAKASLPMLKAAGVVFVAAFSAALGLASFEPQIVQTLKGLLGL